MKVKFIKKYTFADTKDKFEVGDVVSLEAGEAGKLFAEGVVVNYAEEEEPVVEEPVVEEDLTKIVKRELVSHKAVETRNVGVVAPAEDDNWGYGKNGFRQWMADVIVYEAKGVLPPRLKKYHDKVLSSSVAASGGNAIPTGWSGALLEQVEEISDIFARCWKIPQDSNVMYLPYWNETSRALGSRAGGVGFAGTTADGTQTAETNPVFGQHTLTAIEWTSLCHLTLSLIEDSPGSIESMISRLVVTELSRYLEYNILQGGAGTTQFQGIIGSGAEVEVTSTAGSDGCISTQDIWAMVAALPPADYKSANCVWIMNQALLPYLMEALIGSNGAYPVSYIPAGAMGGTTGTYGILAGKPIIMSEFLPSACSNGCLMLANLDKYAIGERRPVQTDTSLHFRFDRSQSSIRVRARYQGRPTEASTRTAADGQSTLGSFAVLTY